ncbi:MAG: hypothetical protein HQL60_09275 [Magnetococcales bacterium]|nr:hypothetical protein [Magnetococcales bacterium]
MPRELLDRAANIQTRSKVGKGEVHAVILALCRGRYLPLRTLSGLLGRSPDYVRPSFLRELVQSGQLELLYPGRLNHPDQAYRTRELEEAIVKNVTDILGKQGLRSSA